MTVREEDITKRIGFVRHGSSTHNARTFLLAELQQLLATVNQPDARPADYLAAIEQDNCLGKRSMINRVLTWRYLVSLYGLDPSLILFRALLYFWHRDPPGQPLLALLCACSRDPILLASVPFILDYAVGTTVTRTALERFIEQKFPDRFSPATLKSTAQNINSTWTKAGYLSGRARKTRVQASPTVGSVSYALLLGYLNGVRGQSLFQTEYVKLLDSPFDHIIQHAEQSSRQGWMVFKHVGNVIEVLFPKVINQKEMEWLREQN